MVITSHAFLNLMLIVVIYIYLLLFLFWKRCREVKKFLAGHLVSKYLGWNKHYDILQNQDGTGVQVELYLKLEIYI